jgi:hypothetical protein
MISFRPLVVDRSFASVRSIDAEKILGLVHLLHAAFLIPRLSHVSRLSEKVGCLLPGVRIARRTCRWLGENLLLVGRLRDIRRAGSAITGGGLVSLLIAREHLLLMLGCRQTGPCTARSGLRLDHRLIEALDLLIAIGKSRSGEEEYDGAGR